MEPLAYPVNIAPLKGQKLAETHPRAGGGEEHRIISRIEGGEQTIHLLGSEDFDFRFVMLMQCPRSLKAPAPIETVHGEEAVLDSIA